jgi:trimeric autotransporter adhesin
MREIELPELLQIGTASAQLNYPDSRAESHRKTTRQLRSKLFRSGILLFCLALARAAIFAQIVVPAPGNIGTVAGNGTAGFSGDGGLATNAELKYPSGAFMDASGNLYITDMANNRIREINAVTGNITTVAGNGTAGYTGDTGLATAAELNQPAAVALDSAGNIYIADNDNNVIRKVTVSTGIITTFAGTGTAGYSGDGGAATSAKLTRPQDVAFDASGNLYIADSYNSVIRVVNISTGIITTVAGTGTAGFSGDGGAATSARLNVPYSIAFDTTGNLYFTDSSNNRLRKITAPISSGIITTVVGNGTSGYSGDGGPATSAEMYFPTGVAVDGAGNIYILSGRTSGATNPNNCGLRKVIAVTGNIYTIAGNGVCSYSGDGGLATSAETYSDYATSIAIDMYGNLYFADPNNLRVRVVAPVQNPIMVPSVGNIGTVAGNGTAGFSGDGGLATNAELKYPSGAFMDASGNLYITDMSNNRIREINAVTGNITTIAGNGTAGYNGDAGSATAAELNAPAAVAVDSSGNIYIADNNNNVVRKVTVSTGIITTFAGTGTAGYSGDGGAATSAKLTRPQDVAFDASGNLYIADSYNSVIRVVNASTGIITTVAGTGTAGYSGDGGAATSAKLQNPYSIAFDTSGNLYIADATNNRIRKITAPISSGTITTVVGNGTSGYSGDGGPATSAEMYFPSGVAVDGAGNIYILSGRTSGAVNPNNCGLRKVIAATGNIYTVAGNGVCSYSGDGGLATSAETYSDYATSIAIDMYGNLYFADPNNLRVRVVASTIYLTPTIVWPTPSAITYGTALTATQLNAVPEVTSNCVYTPALGAVLPAGTQTLSVTCTPTGTTAFSPGVATVSLVVSPAPLTVTANAASRAYGAANPAFTASYSGFVNGDTASVVRGAPSFATTATLSSVVGTYPITPGPGWLSAANYAFNFVNGTLTVTQATPAIAWATPASITYGTGLSATQLNATSNAAGTFAYTPALGTQLTAGTHTLSVTLAPTDTTDFTTPPAQTVALTVNKATPTITWATPASITQGTALSATQLDATSSAAGTFTYNPALGTVLSEGTFTLVANFTPTDTTDYNSAANDVSEVVSPASGTPDSGTVTLTVNSTQVAQVSYGATSTPSSIAESLAAAASTSTVMVSAVGDELYLQSVASGVNYPYSISATSSVYSSSSFLNGGIGGNLEGGESLGASPKTVYSFAGNYDGVGNLSGYTDSTVMGTWTFHYDSLNRLSLGTQTPLTGSAQSFCWTYDSFGNRTTQATSPQPFTNAPGATACVPQSGYTLSANVWANVSSNANNQLANTVQAPGAVVYDQAGDVTYDGVNTYLYDVEGRICAVSSTSADGSPILTGYLYDADGIRVAKGTISTMSCDPTASGFSTTNSYVLGPSGEQVTEMSMDTTSGGSNTLAWQHTNVWAGGKLLGTYDTNGLHFYLDDPLGTRRAQTDYAGVLEQNCASLPFGDGESCQPTPTEHLFTGKERDTESGNDYFGARYYSSAMGRFMSPDWSAKAEPVPYAKLTNPQTLNLYGYMRNNPLGGVDQDGHCDWCQKLWNGITGNGWQTNAQISANNATVTTSQTMTVTLPAAATVAGIAGPPFANQLPQSLSQELADMAAKGITPQSPTSPGFGELPEAAAGKINWTLSTDGELLTTPAVDGVTHAATAGGADVMGAGTAQVTTAGGQASVFDITAQSGHYMNGASAAQSEGAVGAGAAAFGDAVLRDFVLPMVLFKPVSPGGCPAGGC